MLAGFTCNTNLSPLEEVCFNNKQPANPRVAHLGGRKGANTPPDALLPAIQSAACLPSLCPPGLGLPPAVAAGACCAGGDGGGAAAA